MHHTIVDMDNSITKLPTFRETRFRTPSRFERQTGFWVDRLGSAAAARSAPPGLRILGQYAVVAVESGEGTFLTQNRGTHVIRAEDVLFLSPEEPTAYYPNQNWFSRWIVWHGPDALCAAPRHQILDGIDQPDPVFRQAAGVVRQAFFTLTKLMDGEDRAAVLERQAVILNMMAFLLRVRSSAAVISPARSDASVAVQHIQRHLESRLPLSDLAAMCHLSVPHFRRIFRRQMGQSPVEFIMGQRVAAAKTLLARGASIKQVAQETGFASPFYFMRVFKKVAGQTAGNFVATHYFRSGAGHPMVAL